MAVDDKLRSIEEKIDSLRDEVRKLSERQAVQCAQYTACRTVQADHQRTLYGNGNENRGLTYRMVRSEGRWQVLLLVMMGTWIMFTLAVAGFFRWIAEVL